MPKAVVDSRHIWRLCSAERSCHLRLAGGGKCGMLLGHAQLFGRPLLVHVWLLHVVLRKDVPDHNWLDLGVDALLRLLLSLSVLSALGLH